jgi:hypothetical protein
MKNNLVLTMLAILVVTITHAQEFKVSKNSGRLEIHLGRVTVEGYEGNEIVFSTREGKNKGDERAKGLRLIGNLGVEDNTGIGINVNTKGDVLEVFQLKNTNPPDIKILVPKNVVISFQHESQYGGKASFKSLSNKIEVQAQYNSVELENVSGPVAVHTVYGSVDASFATSIKDPITILSSYGHVDVSLPPTIKANVMLNTSFGEILVAPDFKIDVNREGSMVRYTDKVSGKINGGGLDVDLTADYGKVYLRKKA